MRDLYVSKLRFWKIEESFVKVLLILFFQEKYDCRKIYRGD